MSYDFSGWATKNNILCTDGRTIRKDAFKECDGKTVPLVWNHQHNDPENVLGNALLHNEDEGVYAYCSFNETKKAQSAKLAVLHGDVDSLSICATHLKQNGGDVLHGEIKEVSLVLAGANSGAHIDEVIRHGEVSEGEAIIFMNEFIDLEHVDPDMKEEPEKESEEQSEEQNTETEVKSEETSEPEKKTEEVSHADNEPEPKTEEKHEKTVADVVKSFNKKQKDLLYAFIGLALTDDGSEDSDDEDPDEANHADDSSDDSEETVEDIINTMTEEQKNVFYLLVGQARIEAEKADTKHSDEEEEITHNDSNISENTEGGNNMEYNVFEKTKENEEVLTHAEQIEILNDAKKMGSLKEAVLKHGITDISNAYPDYKNYTNRPELIKENQNWVTTVMNGVHHTPFSRIRSIFADITPDEARAKGYAKGTEKVEEVIALLKRETPATTIYKLQKIDRDDVLDITDFDVVAWLKAEMKLKLDEERARAYLIGDGRGISAPGKIDETKIRPIWTMEDLFAVNAVFTVPANATTEDIAKGVIRAAVKGFDDYDGSGNTTAFIATDKLSDLMLLEDGFGHRLYKSKAELASAMLVDNVVGVPVMKNKTRTVSGATRVLDAIIVDLNDYNVGNDKGGQVNWFDDFDIDFNKLEYLIETRESGTLVKPNSAIVVEHVVGE
jgi:hypothetical protein